MRLGNIREEIAIRLPSLNVVIGHHRVHDVIRSPLRHVAAYTIALVRMIGGARESLLMTPEACGVDIPLFTMRIVTRDAL